MHADDMGNTDQRHCLLHKIQTCQFRFFFYVGIGSPATDWRPSAVFVKSELPRSRSFSRIVTSCQQVNVQYSSIKLTKLWQTLMLAFDCLVALGTWMFSTTKVFFGRTVKIRNRLWRLEMRAAD